MNATEFEARAGGKAAVLAALAVHPDFVKPRALASAQAMKTAAAIVENNFTASYRNELSEKLSEAFDMYVINNGDAETVDAERKDDYAAGWDAQIEGVLEEYDALLSANWLGTCTDEDMLAPGAIDRMCSSFGKEVYKQATRDTETNKAKSTAKILSAAGIVEADIEALMQTRNGAKPGENPLTDIRAALAPVYETVYDMYGGEYPDLTDDLDWLTDDDDLMAQAAAERLGARVEDRATFRDFRRLWGDSTVAQCCRLLDEMKANGGPTAAPVEAPAAAETPAPAPSTAPAIPSPTGEKPARKPRTPKAAPQAVSGTVPAECLALFKENAKAKDEDVAEKLGVSRATYNNMVNGKTPCTPDDVQRLELREMMVEKANGMLKALALFDGTEATVIE